MRFLIICFGTQTLLAASQAEPREVDTIRSDLQRRTEELKWTREQLEYARKSRILAEIETLQRDHTAQLLYDRSSELSRRIEAVEVAKIKVVDRVLLLEDELGACKEESGAVRNRLSLVLAELEVWSIFGFLRACTCVCLRACVYVCVCARVRLCEERSFVESVGFTG